MAGTITTGQAYNVGNPAIASKYPPVGNQPAAPQMSVTGQYGPQQRAATSTQNVGGGSYYDNVVSNPNSSIYGNARNAANAGYPVVGTGYLYGVGGQTLGQQSHTYTPPNPYVPGGRGNVGAGPTNPGQMTWGQWTQNMQNQYGIPNPGTLGGTANGGGGSPVGGYPAGYTGYGNSNIGVQGGQTPSSASTPPPVTFNVPPQGSTPPPAAAPGSTPTGMNGLQQLINQGNKPQINPTQNTTNTSPVPFANLSAPKPLPTQPLQPLGLSNMGSFLLAKPGHPYT